MLPVTTLVINVSSVALIWFGGMRIDAGQMQVGSLIAFLSYFMQILMAVLMATFILVIVAARVGVCGADHRGAVHRRLRSPAPRRPSPPTDRRRDPVRRRDVQLSRRGPPCAARCFADRAAGDHDRRRRVDGVGQVDADVVDLPAVRRHRRLGARRRDRRARLRRRTAVVGDRPGPPTRLPVLGNGRRQPALRQGRRDRRGDVGRAARGRGRRLRRRPPRRTRDARLPGRHELLRRAAPAAGDRARRHPPARRSICSTTRSPRSTCTPTRASAPRCATCPPTPRWSLSRSAFRRWRRPTRSSSSTTAGWWAPGRTSICSPTA